MKIISNLREMYNQVTSQFTMYMGHVAKYIGGIMETPKMVEDKDPFMKSYQKQNKKKQLIFLINNCLPHPPG